MEDAKRKAQYELVVEVVKRNDQFEPVVDGGQEEGRPSISW